MATTMEPTETRTRPTPAAPPAAPQKPAPKSSRRTVFLIMGVILAGTRGYLLAPDRMLYSGPPEQTRRLLVVVTDRNDVWLLTTVTLAPGTTAPVLSLTVPTRVALSI